MHIASHQLQSGDDPWDLINFIQLIIFCPLSQLTKERWNTGLRTVAETLVPSFANLVALADLNDDTEKLTFPILTVAEGTYVTVPASTSNGGDRKNCDSTSNKMESALLTQ